MQYFKPEYNVKKIMLKELLSVQKLAIEMKFLNSLQSLNIFTPVCLF